jgi:hypothetical protein
MRPAGSLPSELALVWDACRWWYEADVKLEGSILQSGHCHRRQAVTMRATADMSDQRRVQDAKDCQAEA